MVTNNPDTSLVGTWKLLSREDVTARGERRGEPKLGSNPIAYLMYDAAGHFAVQFMRRDRDRVEATTGQSPGDAANNTGAVDGYDAYFGRYTVANDSTVTQELLGALSPRDVGKVVTRRFRIDGDELVIDLQTTSHDGEPVTRTLRWERLA
jgi:lipocalin-like protein